MRVIYYIKLYLYYKQNNKSKYMIIHKGLYLLMMWHASVPFQFLQKIFYFDSSGLIYCVILFYYIEI